jgi:hypothetical protein
VIGSVRRLVHVLAAAALAAGALAVIGVAPASAAGSVGYVIAQGEGECWLASVDLVSGLTTPIGAPSTEKCAFDLEFTPDGTRLLGTRVDEDEFSGIAHLLEFDLTTGDITDLGQLGDFEVGGPGFEQGNLTLPATGGLFTYLVPGDEGPILEAVDPACDGSAFCLFQGDAATPGSLAYVNSVPQTFTVYYGLATSCADVTSSVRAVQLANAASFASPTAIEQVPQILTTVNRTATGPGSTDVGPVGDGVFLTSVDYDTAGTLHGVGFEPENVGPSIFTVDTATGAATHITTLNDGEAPLNLDVLGFAIAHPCSTPPPPPAPPEPPAAQPIAAVTPRFTG